MYHFIHEVLPQVRGNNGSIENPLTISSSIIRKESQNEGPFICLLNPHHC